MVKNLAAIQEIPGLGPSPGEGNGYPLTPVLLPGEFRGQITKPERKEVRKVHAEQSFRGFPDGSAGKCKGCRTHGLNSWVGMEEEMATHSSILA